MATNPTCWTAAKAPNTVSYRHSPSSVTVRLTNGAGNGFKGDAAGDTLSNFENIIGSNYDDILTGDSNPNIIEGLGGADTLDGGGGGDTLSYESSNAGVTIDLKEGDGDFDTTNNTIETSSGGHATGDKIKYGSFFNVIGSAHRDTLTGDNGPNTLRGGGGNDTLNGDDGVDILDGGPGGDTLDGGEDTDTDTATFANATAGIIVDLSGSTDRGTGGEARSDTYKNIDKYVGSRYDDTFIAGSDEDDFDGGEGTDTISYERSGDPVEVNLRNTNQPDTGDEDNYARKDMLTSIENIIGSNVSSGEGPHDSLTGNDKANVIDGLGGDDTLNGEEGADTLIGGRGDDILNGGLGTDTLTGGRGDDMLTGGGDADTFKFTSRRWLR